MKILDQFTDIHSNITEREKSRIHKYIKKPTPSMWSEIKDIEVKPNILLKQALCNIYPNNQSDPTSFQVLKTIQQIIWKD